MTTENPYTCHYGDRCFAAAGLKLRQADASFQRFIYTATEEFLFGCWDRGALWLTVKAAPHEFSYLLSNYTLAVCGDDAPSH